jgi:hypothetical protein
MFRAKNTSNHAAVKKASRAKGSACALGVVACRFLVSTASQLNVPAVCGQAASWAERKAQQSLRAGRPRGSSLHRKLISQSLSLVTGNERHRRFLPDPFPLPTF